MGRSTVAATGVLGAGLGPLPAAPGHRPPSELLQKKAGRCVFLLLKWLMYITNVANSKDLFSWAPHAGHPQSPGTPHSSQAPPPRVRAKAQQSKMWRLE